MIWCLAFSRVLFRFGIAVGLAVGIRCPGRIALVDGEARARVGDVVVREHPSRSERGADVVGGWAGIRSGERRVGGGGGIGSDKGASKTRSKRNRIGIAIGLDVVIRCPGRMS